MYACLLNQASCCDPPRYEEKTSDALTLLYHSLLVHPVVTSRRLTGRDQHPQIAGKSLLHLGIFHL